MKPLYALIAVFLVSTVMIIWIAEDDRKAQRELGRTQVERDSALARVADLQKQIDDRKNLDRDIEDRMRTYNENWEKEHLKDMSRQLEESWDRYECEHDAGCYGYAAPKKAIH